MKFGVRVLIALCTFLLGVVVSAVWHVIPWRTSSPVATTKRVMLFQEANSNGGCRRGQIPSVSLCDLVRDSDRYDGRIVRVEGIYHQGKDTASVNNESSLNNESCGAWVNPKCIYNDEACTRIWRQVLDVADKSSQVVKVDAVGRFYADQADEVHPGRRVNTLEILELKDVTTVPTEWYDAHK